MELTSAQHKEIRESLEQFGLSETEGEAYLALLSLGVTTATPLAQRMHIPLTTAQSLLRRLGDLGLANVTQRKSRHVYEAKDPQVFKRLLEQRLQDMSHAIPLMAGLMSAVQDRATIRIYRRERVIDIFQQALQCKHKQIYEIVSARDLQKVMGERLHFTKRRMEKKISLKSLRVEAHEIKKYSRQSHERELREAKFLPREFDFRCSIFFWDDTIAFFSPEDEAMAWMMRSSSMTVFLRQLFELLWSVGRRMETA